MNRKYVLILAFASVILLVAGSVWRPKPVPLGKPPVPAAEAPPAPPPSRRGQMRQISEFVAERAHEVGAHVAYVPQTQASGVWWTADSLVSTGENSPVVIVRASSVAPVAPAGLAPESRLSQGGWLLVVGRNQEGLLISASSMLGGTAEITCAGARVPKLVFSAPLDRTFAGAGVFDIAGELLGMVVSCGGSWVAVGHRGLNRLLEEQQGAEAHAWSDFGVRVRRPEEAEIRALRLSGDGLFVTEVRKKSRAYAIGIRPGDVLTLTDGKPLVETEDLFRAIEAITLRRDGRTLSVPVEPAFSFEPFDAGPVLSSVEPESRLYAAGVRPGDRIVQIGRDTAPAPARITRALASKAPVYLVYDREDRRVGVLLP